MKFAWLNKSGEGQSGGGQSAGGQSAGGQSAGGQSADSPPAGGCLSLNEKLIMFFCGWGYDENPFKFLDCGDYDVVVIYDYGNLNLDIDFSQYKECNLIAWSMGVFIASCLQDELPEFKTKIAINGTPYPVDDKKGIPVKIFELTLKHAQTGLQGKFYRNVIDNDVNFEKYLTNPVQRTIENRVDELHKLYDLIRKSEFDYDKYYDFALIGQADKIIPSQNQTNAWEGNTPYKILECGHFPYYNYKSWAQILTAVSDSKTACGG